MYILRIKDRITNKITESNHQLFLTTMIRIMKHKLLNNYYSILKWETHKENKIMTATTNKHIYWIEKITRPWVLKILVIIGFATLFSGIILYTTLFTPTLYESFSTKECIYIESYNNEYGCSNIPNRYNHVWIE